MADVIGNWNFDTIRVEYAPCALSIRAALAQIFTMFCFVVENVEQRVNGGPDIMLSFAPSKDFAIIICLLQPIVTEGVIPWLGFVINLLSSL
eukprot:scaffold1404_cov37-Cyclotella_meneghiniana.AAC.5